MTIEETMLPGGIGRDDHISVYLIKTISNEVEMELKFITGAAEINIGVLYKDDIMKLANFLIEKVIKIDSKVRFFGL